MKQIFRFLFLIPILSGLAACEFNDERSLTIGDRFMESETSILVLDTFRVRLSTVLIDSIPTSGMGIALAGNYLDEELGHVSCKSYFQMSLPAFTISEIDKDDRFDSIVFQASYQGKYYGDTTVTQTFRLHQLTNMLEITEGSYLFNTTSFPYRSDPVGSLQLRPRPLTQDRKLSMRLSDEFGLTLFNLMKNDAPELDNESDFLKFTKGFVLLSETENSSVVGLQAVDSLLTMTIYAHRFTTTGREDYTCVMQMTSKSLQFNQVTSNRTTTDLSNLTRQREKLLTSETGNKAFMQAGTGIMTRIEFPGLQRLLEFDRKHLLVKAELILRPKPFSFKEIDLPATPVLYESDYFNTWMDEVTDASGKSVTPTLSIDPLYNETTYYKFDITNFIANELIDAYFDVDHGLLLGLSANDFYTTLDRIVFSDEPNTMFVPELKLYYIFYN